MFDNTYCTEFTHMHTHTHIHVAVLFPGDCDDTPSWRLSHSTSPTAFEEKIKHVSFGP